MNVKLPYGKTHVGLDIPGERIAAVIDSKVNEYKPESDEKELVRQALMNPIDSPRVCDLAEKAGKVLLITSDHTRPVPSKTTLPIYLEEIRRKNPAVKIKILIATGFHRPTTTEEMIDKFGSEIVKNEELINHVSGDFEKMAYKGVLPSGARLYINNLIDWADLVVSEGFIEPHFFAGFSGGRKSILPGICSQKTVFANHCAKFIASPKAVGGNLAGNPIHEDMVDAAEKAGLAFILNVVLNDRKEIIHAVAGHAVNAHLAGCDFMRSLAGAKPVWSDIVMTSNGGYPLDQNIYQAVKGMSTAAATVNRGGVIIIAASCSDGHGGEEFYSWGKRSPDASKLTDEILKIPAEDTIADQWQVQVYAKVRARASVIFVSDLCNPPELIEDMHMIRVNTLEEALARADQILGGSPKITVIPDGVSVFINE